jgi:outer membrane protein OmpA-like peptidoglycan-associated protein
MLTQAVNAQEPVLAPSSTWDNWYFGVEAGAATKATHNAMLRNINPVGGFRIGRYLTPVFGFAVEGDIYGRSRNFVKTNTLVKAADVNLLATLNLTNWLRGYHGTPHSFEAVAVLGPGLNHVFGHQKSVEDPKNDLTAKFGIDFNFNIGSKHAWQLFLEPSFNYNLDRYGRKEFNVNTLALQLLLGVNYKFRNSNGTHNFSLAILRDQNEWEVLNARVNELRYYNETKDKQIKSDARTIELLKKELEAAQNAKPAVVEKKIVQQVVNHNVLQPTVIFGLGKSTVDAAQMASVAMIAKYMKNHPDSRLLIKGYASPEGNPQQNQLLSEKRAQSVKDVLVKRYGISADRLEIQGMGATSELFDEIDFNRVATFIDLTK